MLGGHCAKLGNLDHNKHHVNFVAMSADQDILYMSRALELAEKGRGQVSPNPMVGCVIVHEGKVIGEGWHQQYGGPHAEVNAINSVKDQSLLSASTCYVTLEPCSHHGKTPPCADLLIDKKLERVVIGCKDSNPLVGGKGIEGLLSAGIHIEDKVLESACRKLNERFFSLVEKNRPYIILKWAETADGFIARENYDSKWISNQESRTLVHQWRAEEDAILVGTNTAQYDNPKLNVRDWKGRDPIRVVIDKDLRLKEELNLFDRSQPTIIYNCQRESKEENLNFVKLESSEFMHSLIQDLGTRKIQSVIVEGGAAVLNSLIELDLWDEARVFVSNQQFEKGIEAPILGKTSQEEYNIETDKLSIYYNE